MPPSAPLARIRRRWLARLRPVCSLFIAVMLVAVGARGAGAQVGSTTDIIVGTVRAPDGRPVPGAMITVTSLDTEIARSRTTDNNGRYTILFPDGGGRYRLEVRLLGFAPVAQLLIRDADEDRLVADINLVASAATLETVTVRGRAQAPPGGRGDQPTPGDQGRVVTGEQASRLPIDAGDLQALAALTPGVVTLAATDSAAAAFSVAGQRPDLNQITLDGLSFGGSAVPEEAVRSTRVITSTYDVARGQFSGGQISSTTRGGTNLLQSTFNFSLRDPTLQWVEEDDQAFGGAYMQHQLSGGVGGPIVRNKVFAFGSFRVQRTTRDLQALTVASPSTLDRLGIDVDSASRFTDLVSGYGLSPAVAGIGNDQIGDNATLLTRFDWRLTQDHTLMLRGDYRYRLQDASRISAFSLPHNGGDQRGNGGGAMLTLSSQWDRGFINELRAYISTDQSNSDPYLLVPDGRVRVSSSLADGTVGVRNLEFGGNPGLPQSSTDQVFELTNEVSWLPFSGGHRVKLGALLNVTRFSRGAAANQYGTFTFNSLEDFAANDPASFTRSLSPVDRTGGMLSSAVYLGDTWRRDRQLQVTYGARLEYSKFLGTPEYNPVVEQTFGRRTDEFPGDLRLSPRVGFTYTIGGGRGTPANYVIRGGVGEFRGRAPQQLFTGALNATGLPDGQQTLYCIGDAVPVPNWEGYAADPSAIPSACDGEATPITGRSAPTVTTFDRDFGAPRSWRTSLGVQRRLFGRFQLSVDGSYSYGVGLYGVQDLNLDTSPKFTLAGEGNRPVYVAPGAIIPATGAVSLTGSRADDRFAQVFAVGSGLKSHTGQITTGFSGLLWRGILFNTSYTFARSRDQSSFSGGSASGGFASPTTAGNPNLDEWGVSDFERRHVATASLTYSIRPWIEVTAVGRATSGSRYTPRVAGDVNGDGTRNDRAFIFDPSLTADPVLADGIQRLLATAPGDARECLTSQLGSIAGRNSCLAPWVPSLDLRFNLRPTFAALQRRLTMSVVLVNPLTGADELINGRNSLKGWGQQARPDATLLYVTGFDPAAQQFSYEVNERFGDTRRTRSAIVAPFQIGLQARLQFGRDPQRDRMDAMMGRAPVGGGAGGAATTPEALRERFAALVPNPYASILALRDTLVLSESQITRLTLLSDSLALITEPLVDTLVAALGGGGGGMGAGQALQRLRPQLEIAQRERATALQRAQAILSPQQWARVPAAVKAPPTGFGAPGQGGQGRPGGQRPPGGGGRPPV